MSRFDILMGRELPPREPPPNPRLAIPDGFLSLRTCENCGHVCVGYPSGKLICDKWVSNTLTTTFFPTLISSMIPLSRRPYGNGSPLEQETL